MSSGVDCRSVSVPLMLLVLLASYSLGLTGRLQESDTSAPGATPKPENNRCTLVGTVINSETGEPIRRAAVALFGAQGGGKMHRAMLTDSAGRFEFDGLAEGRAFVSVMKPGFVDGRSIPGGAAAANPFQISRDAAPIVITLSPAGVIVGRVTTRSGQPLEGFEVRAIAKKIVGGQQMLSNAGAPAQTNENGEFRIAGLPPDTYYIAVDQNQETTLSQRGVENAREQVYAQSYYPGVSDASAASPLEVPTGREVEAKFVLAAEPIYQVGGTVSARGEPVSILTFTRKAGETSDFTQSAQLQDGKFQVKLPAGSYTVAAFTANGGRLTTPGGSVVITNDNQNLHIPMSPMPSIQVEVQAEQTNGATELGLPLQVAPPAMYLELVPHSPFSQARNFWRFPMGEIQNVEPGIYMVEITTTGKWRVKSAKCGGIDLLSDGLTVADGAPPPIEVTLRDDAASVLGTVTQADSLEPATVLLVQPHGHRNLLRTAEATKGKFEFQSVPPGDYMLFAFDHADQLEYGNPEILNAYLSNAIHINVQPHGAANVNLVITPVGR